MNYDLLLETAHRDGISVYEYTKFNSKRIKGLYIDGNIALSNSISDSKEKACILAEELGHHFTSFGNIIDMRDTQNRKQEYRARIWAYNKQIGLMGLINAFNHGCSSQYDIAEYLDVTEEFLSDAIECYTAKYGTCVNVGGYIIYFIPTLVISKMIG